MKKFKLRSGNKVSFKDMGSSPVKHSAYGQPHPKNTDTGVEESSHPSSAAAHNVKPEKKKSPAKQKDSVVIGGKTYPKGYTKEDVKFLKEQREDVVRYEDLDAKGKAIWKKQGKPIPKTKKKSPIKKHDGTTSSTTHYKDGSAKSKREVDFSKRHEAEVKKGVSTPNQNLPYQKRKEQLLNQGFTQKDADQMIKSGAVTGRVNEKAKAEHPKYEKRKKWKPAYEGGDYSKKDLRKMSRKERKKIEKGQE